MHHLELGGTCEELRKELESSDNSTVKLAAWNNFLDSLGSTTKQDFWDLIDEAKADAAKNMPSDEAKELAVKIITEFSNGQLFLPHDQVSTSIRSQFKELSESDQTYVKTFAKNYGKEIKALIFPLLPTDCKVNSPIAQAAAAESSQKGFDDPDTDTISRRKRHIAFFENIAAAYRQMNRNKFQ
ncbi:unnamed protein product [Caenorhabditis angaria]|uniref:Uncharacterized protein n=1 Tax=Caenorhabditis angaria TaxID=860376 RepID=A0A9P1N3Z4_9PELO|nr:unnamed protein product [Caenorhabditis angaria]